MIVAAVVLKCPGSPRHDISCVRANRKVRLSGFPYRLQWLISPTTTDEDKADVCARLFASDEHCLPLFARSLRILCPSIEALRGHRGQEAIRTLESALGFATDEVERENSHMARASKSEGKETDFYLF